MKSREIEINELVKAIFHETDLGVKMKSLRKLVEIIQGIDEELTRERDMFEEDMRCDFLVGNYYRQGKEAG